MSNPVRWVDCPACNLIRGVAEVREGWFLVLSPCGHTVSKSEASGLVIEEVF